MAQEPITIVFDNAGGYKTNRPVTMANDFCLARSSAYRQRGISRLKA
jgi:hypothetical protein